jgi:hypothetical protein
MKPPKYTPLIFFCWLMFSLFLFDSLNLPLGETIKGLLHFGSLMLMAWWWGYPLRQKMLAKEKEHDNGA